MATITDPKSFTVYRTAPDGWATCHRKTGHAERVTEAQAKAIQDANANAKPEPTP